MPMPLRILVMALLQTLPVMAQVGQVKSVEIWSTWVGLGTPGESHIQIKREGDAYKTSEGAMLPSARVEAFVNAISASSIEKPDLENLGVTVDWLKRNAEKAIGEQFNGNRSGEPVPTELTLCISTFQNPDLIRPYVLSQFSGCHTDDYPSIEIEVKTTTGGIVVKSTSQHQFMLPWEIKKVGKQSKTLDARISRALFALLPEKFVNRDRLIAEYFAEALARDLVFTLGPQLNRLRVDGMAKWILDEYLSEYEVQDTGIMTNPFEGEHITFPAFATEWGKYDSSRPFFQCQLKRKEFPPAFWVRVVFPFAGATKSQVKQSMEDLKSYESLIFEIPWLDLHLRRHPSDEVELCYVSDRSFTDLAMREFSKDMKNIGKEALSREVSTVQKQVCLLRVTRNHSSSYSLVLPDHRVILWRSNNTKDPHWQPSASGDSREGISRGRMGDVISPTGKLLTN